MLGSPEWLASKRANALKGRETIRRTIEIMRVSLSPTREQAKLDILLTDAELADLAAHRRTHGPTLPPTHPSRLISSTSSQPKRSHHAHAGAQASHAQTPLAPAGAPGPTLPSNSYAKIESNGVSARQGAAGASSEPVRKKNAVEFSLSVRQNEALSCEIPFLLYGGAKGGGKSWWLCVWAFIRGQKYKKDKGLLCRKRSVDFTNTTLETWKKAIPSKYYKINEQKKKIFLYPSGTVIDYGGLDDPEKVQALNSAEYSFIGGDQFEETEQDQFAMLRGTLRHKLPDGTEPPYQIRMTANPGQCWLKEAFILHPKDNFKFIPALPTDNPYLPASYVPNLEEAFKHRPGLLAAYLHGSWDDLSGNDTCIRGAHIEEAKARRIPDGPVLKRIIINDPAITGDENVTFCMEQRGNVAYIADRYVIEHKRPLETAALLAAYRKRMHANLIAVDKIGIGEGVIDGLAQLEEPYYALNSAAAPTQLNALKRYGNLRAQMWWEAGDKFAQNRVCLPPDDLELARQLGAIRFDLEKLVKLFVQSKADIRGILGRSCDDADAYVMGLFVLEHVAQPLNWRAEEEAETDRVGHGEPLIAAEQDFSGYALAG